MSEQLVIALIGSATAIVVTTIPILLPKWLGFARSGQGTAPYPWASVLAVGISVVAIVVSVWPRPAPQIQLYRAQTEPAYQPIATETSPGSQYGVDGLSRMFRYTLNFEEPVDVVIPQQLSYTNKWVLWKVEKAPSDQSGRRWIVSFQCPEPQYLKTELLRESTGHASFVGLRFPR